MKLAQFTHSGHCRLGAVEHGLIADLGSVRDIPRTVRELLAVTSDPVAFLTPALTQAVRIALSDVVLHAPIDDPRHFFGVGLNYANHAAETNAPLPTRPRFFAKLASSITGPAAPLVHPGFSDTLDYEGELGVVIGQVCRDVPRARAREVVAGYLVVNDVSVREWVDPDLVVLAKGCATFAPLGPWLTTADEVPDPHALRIQTRVNGELRQDASTSGMLFDCWALIEWISKAIELQPGDMITTGSPKGSGVGYSPPRYLRAGDTVSVSIAPLGDITNTVRERNWSDP